MIKRWWIYLSEMYPPFLRLVFATVFFFGPYFSLQALSGDRPMRVDLLACTGVLTIFFFLLFLRISDEFKDYELDCRLFPERPLPSGRVTKRDLRVLLGMSVGAMLALNLVFGTPTPGFFLLLGFGFLMLKFFFIKERIQKSLLLALATHNPSVLLIHFYTASLLASATGRPAFTTDFALIAIVFFLPGLAWELSRKVRAPQDENEYVTYSRIFGHRVAAINPAVLYVAHFSLTFWLAERLGLETVFLSLLGIVCVVCVGCSVRFILNPNTRTAKLKPPSEAYLLLSNLGLTLALLQSHGAVWVTA